MDWSIVFRCCRGSCHHLIILVNYFQDQDVETDCVGWASYNKNFSFVREALEVMCSPEFNVTGVLVANENKAGTMACTIPSACDGKIIQTTFLDQEEFFGYLVKVCRFIGVCTPFTTQS